MEHTDLRCRGAEAVLKLEPNSTVAVTYHPLFGQHDDLLLLEIDDKLLLDLLHNRVTLRGHPDEDAVLCTQSKTYAIKFVGTSNSAFLIPPSGQFIVSESTLDCHVTAHDKQFVARAIKVPAGNMELTEVAPRLDKLRVLLTENPYSSNEVLELEDLGDVEKNSRGLYKWDDLVERIQASNDELRTGLQALSAVEIDKYWRIVDEKYMGTILKMLLHNLVLNDWSLDGLNEDEVVSVLASDGFPRKLAQHCLHVYGRKVEGGRDTSCLWRLDEKRVCVHYAREILREGKMKMESFMEKWLRKIPDGMQARFEMLEGEVLTEKLGVDMWVRAFSVSWLPSTPSERFSVLFRVRSKWEWKDLQPYIRDLNAPGLSSEGLLLKYTRRTQSSLDAEPVFSAR